MTTHDFLEERFGQYLAAFFSTQKDSLDNATRASIQMTYLTGVFVGAYLVNLRIKEWYETKDPGTMARLHAEIQGELEASLEALKKVNDDTA